MYGLLTMIHLFFQWIKHYNTLVRWSKKSYCCEINLCSSCFIVIMLGNLFLLSKIRNFLSFNVRRTRIVNKNKEKMEACWWNGCKCLGKLPSDYVEVALFWKYHSHFSSVLNFCPLSDSQFDGGVNIHHVAPGRVCHQARRDRGAPRVCTWKTGDRGERWEGVTQRRRQVAWVSLCVFDKYSLKNPRWR